jgi:hypothetical protein
MSHPCDGHACDHCYLCDVVGICCATVPHAAVRFSTPESRLREAIVQDAAGVRGLAQLIQDSPAEQSLIQLIRAEPVKIIRQGPRPALLPGPPRLNDSNSHTTEEVTHVFAARRHS